jgi:VAD1 Analog of StAR-related lipid transfer domain
MFSFNFKVHTCYGEQLGLTSDDEDYIDPTPQGISEDVISGDSISAEEPFETKASSSSSNNKLASEDSSSFQKTKKGCIKKKDLGLHLALPSIQHLSNLELMPTDMSGTDSDSEIGGSKMDFINDAECDSMHEGRQLVHTILPLSIETVFGLMFHKSKFFTDFHKMRKTTNLVQGEWEDLSDGTKKRVINLTVAIAPLVGPKSSHVTETQIMRTCSRNGLMYSIDATSENAGE